MLSAKPLSIPPQRSHSDDLVAPVLYACAVTIDSPAVHQGGWAFSLFQRNSPPRLNTASRCADCDFDSLLRGGGDLLGPSSVGSALFEANLFEVMSLLMPFGGVV